MNETAEAGTVDTQTENRPPELSQPSLATLEAGREALGMEIPLNARGKPRGKPGRPITHGKYAKKNRVPVGSLDAGTSPLLVEDEIETAFSPVPDSHIDPPFDKEAARPYAEAALDGLNELNREIVYWRVFRKTKDKEGSELISAAQEIPPVARRLMLDGALGCCEKYHIDPSKSPEAALAGGFILWQMKSARSIREGIEQLIKSRQNAR